MKSDLLQKSTQLGKLVMFQPSQCGILPPALVHRNGLSVMTP
jgi:hypothetical protein